MSLITVEGTYKGGRVELTEAPQGVDGAKVLVTFIPAEPESRPPAQEMKFGQFRGPVEQMSTEEDFKAAEWHPSEDQLRLQY